MSLGADGTKAAERRGLIRIVDPHGRQAAVGKRIGVERSAFVLVGEVDEAERPSRRTVRVLRRADLLQHRHPRDRLDAVAVARLDKRNANRQPSRRRLPVRARSRCTPRRWRRSAARPHNAGGWAVTAR